MNHEWPPALIPTTLRVDECKQRLDWLLWNIRNRRNKHKLVSQHTTDQIERKTCYMKRNDHSDNKQKKRICNEIKKVKKNRII